MLSFGMLFLCLIHCCFCVLQKLIMKLSMAAENSFNKKRGEMRLEECWFYLVQMWLMQHNLIGIYFVSWKHCQFNAKVLCTAKILLQNCLYFQLVAFPFSSHGKRYGKDSFSLSQLNPKCNMHKQVLPFPQAGVHVKPILAIWKRKIFHTLILFLKCISLPVDSGKEGTLSQKVELDCCCVWSGRKGDSWIENCFFSPSTVFTLAESVRFLWFSLHNWEMGLMSLYLVWNKFWIAQMKNKF